MTKAMTLRCRVVMRVLGSTCASTKVQSRMTFPLLAPSSYNYSTESVEDPLNLEAGPIFTFPVTIGSSRAQQDQLLYFDTGSTLIWVQCEPSDPSCQIKPEFKPYLSPTYDALLPSSSFCTGTYTADKNKGCGYDATYGEDLVNTIGVLATERFGFPSATVHGDEDSVSYEDLLVFGCSSKTVSAKPGFRRVLGMGNRQESLPFQLLSLFDGFSYCLSLTGQSSVTFGDDLELQLGQRTPLMKKITQSENKYYVELLGLAMNDKHLGIGADLFRRDANRGGCFIDSGCTNSRMKTEAFVKVKAELDDLLKDYLTTEIHNFEMCYDVPDNFKLPTLTYYLNGAELQINGDKLFVPMRSRLKLWRCATILKSATRTIIGTRHQLDTRIAINLATQIVAFAPEVCMATRQEANHHLLDDRSN